MSMVAQNAGIDLEQGVVQGLYRSDLVAQVMSVLGPVIVAFIYISLCSLFEEPNRRNFNAVMVAGAGAAYLNGGFGIWGFAFTVVVTYCAYKGLKSLHTGWDVLHHLYGNPIVPFVADSSFGCAICDPVIALWCFAGAPSVYDLFRRRRREEPDPAP
jgi:hypothetical protein